MSADDVSWWANWILVGALLVGVAATYAIVVSGNIKEANLKRELKEKDDALEKYKLTVEGKVADAKSEGIKAGETAGNALVRAAELEKEAAAARLETEKIKQLVAWRVVVPQERDAIRAELKDTTGNINLQYAANDPEAMTFAIQLGNSFDPERWKVGLASMSYNGVVGFGVFIWGDSDPAKAVRSAFRAAKIPFSTEPINASSIGFGMPDRSIQWNVTIFVGSKKPPSL
jgi:hypothetical protein